MNEVNIILNSTILKSNIQTWKEEKNEKGHLLEILISRDIIYQCYNFFFFKQAGGCMSNLLLFYCINVCAFQKR